jgi:SAM-dependent methyltransferase
MATSGIFEYDAPIGTYWLPNEHAACLTGAGVENLAPLAFFTTVLGKHVPAVTKAFREGGGVPYTDYLPELHDAQDALWGPMYRDLLVPEILPLAPGLAPRLEAGARAADVACGTGNGLVVLAEEFPTSMFVGYDVDADALARGRAEAARRGLTNVTFEECDAAELKVERPFDAVFVFNAIHDQVAPPAVLRRIHDALVPGGTFLMNEPRLSSHLEDNIGNPLAPFTYAVSTLHCMTVSLAHGGAGLGTAWGEQLALKLLADAGFDEVAVNDAPGDPGNAVFVTTKPAASVRTDS